LGKPLNNSGKDMIRDDSTTLQVFIFTDCCYGPLGIGS
jgi:hypothetical protein